MNWTSLGQILKVRRTAARFSRISLVPEVVNTLKVLPLSGRTHPWVLLGTPSDRHKGSVTVLQATAAGTPGPATVWNQDSPKIKNRAESGDLFGYTVG